MKIQGEFLGNQAWSAHSTSDEWITIQQTDMHPKQHAFTVASSSCEAV